MVIPKGEEPAQLSPVYHQIARIAAGDRNARARFIIAGIESVRGVQSVTQLCRTELGVRAVYLGAEDYAAAIAGRRTAGGREVFVARCIVVIAAKGSDSTPSSTR
ncbi:aldolase/citrate lyase family protein [Bradyrhizobium sp. WSM3983]|uniref:aldolase/citrate lyase family protein n=1 Tax=Bradyrhizobium sp. WSM3983 TaxID=1038867 RepID=UPI00047F6E8D|nr:aldolase/citrate lyase family protein [Bradyrhizobium sp. WSM3983]